MCGMSIRTRNAGGCDWSHEPLLQTLMPSLDYTLSFHIGLMARVAAHRGPEGSEAEQEFLRVTNRKMVQASEAFDQADEAEEFQAVGMRCRECLLALVQELTDGSD